MKIFIASLFLILSAISAFTTAPAQAQVCQLKLSDLSRFADEEKQITDRVGLLKFLTQDNPLLFSPLHFQIAQTLITRDRPLDKFKDNYKLLGVKQQRIMAEEVWKSLVGSLNPFNVSYLADTRKYELIKAKNPEGLLDVDELSMVQLEALKRKAAELGYDYENYLKTYVVSEAIEQNPEIKKEVINFIALSLYDTVIAADSFKKKKGVVELLGENKGGFLFGSEYMFGLNALGGMGLSIPYFAHMGGATPLPLILGGLTSVVATPALYSSTRGLQVAYYAAQYKLRTKRALKNLTKKIQELNQNTPDNSEE